MSKEGSSDKRYPPAIKPSRLENTPRLKKWFVNERWWEFTRGYPAQLSPSRNVSTSQTTRNHFPSSKQVQHFFCRDSKPYHHEATTWVWLKRIQSSKMNGHKNHPWFDVHPSQTWGKKRKKPSEIPLLPSSSAAALLSPVPRCGSNWSEWKTPWDHRDLRSFWYTKTME